MSANRTKLPGEPGVDVEAGCMTTHATAKLYHYTKHLNLCMMQCNAASVKMILGAVIPTWSPGGEEWPSDRLDRRRKS